MTTKKMSAGVLAYRIKSNQLEVLLVHPGGPYFVKKDVGVWSIPKGEFTEEEEPLAAAKREFKEETGHELSGDFIALSPVMQKGGKTVFGWAIEQDIDAALCHSNTFDLEWPPKSGRQRAFPEVDRAEWFNAAFAEEKINAGQVALLHELINILAQENS